MKAKIEICCSLAVISLAIGCATTGYEKALRTTASIADTRKELVQVKQQVTVTLEALDKVTSQTVGDARPAYKQYSDCVRRMEASADHMRQHALKAQIRGDAYFHEWEQDLNNYRNTEVRALSEQRRTELMTSYGKISTSMQATQDAFTPFLSDLRDVQRFLQQDLTKAGIGSLSNVVQKARSTGVSAQQRIDTTIQDLNQAAIELKPLVDR